MLRARLLAIVAVVALMGAKPALAQDFFAGKTITLTTGFGTGGGFDNYIRLVAQYLGSHIPGHPLIKPVNRPGGGGRTDANLSYAADPKDGTFISLLAPWMVTDPLIGAQGANFDPTKFNWLLSAAQDVSTCMFWKRTGVLSFTDLLKKGEVTVGSTGPSAVPTTDALLLNEVFGTKIRVIHGYKSTNEAFLAAERGELDGACGMWISSVTSSFMGPLNSGDATVIVQLGTWRHPAFPKATHILEDLKPSEEDAKFIKAVLAQLDMARPFVVPPGVPAERVAILRKAFETMLADPTFLGTAKQRGLEVKPVSGERIQQMIAEIYAMPKPMVERVKKIIGN